MKVLLFTIAFLSSLVCVAQYDPIGTITLWTDGYVVTTENDTINGRVRVGSSLNDSPASVIIQTADDKKIKVKGADLRLLVQRIPNFAYSTGSIPRSREMVIFERVPNPRRNGKLMLLERLTPLEGRIALYFDATGWKKTSEYTSDNFSAETHRQDLSYVVVKDGKESFVAKRADMEAVHDKLFGDCPAFVQQYPTATRRSWNRFGEMVGAYNQLCQQQ